MPVSAETLAEHLEIADMMLAGRGSMLDPQDLPGRYGRVVKSLDQVVAACNCEAVIGGGWSVWRHGYLGRVTQDVDIALPADRLDEFLRVAVVNGFEVHSGPSNNWPKMQHRDTGIEVDILPEGSRPGTEAHPAPTTIPHPKNMGAEVGKLNYISLASLIELKLAAGRLRDEADVEELIRENPMELEKIQRHLNQVHPRYVARFAELVERSQE